MSKIEKIRNYVDQIFHQIHSQEERRCAFVHTYGVAQCCSLLATKRGLDPELAYVCGLLHDVYSYKTGYRTYHSLNGAEMFRVVFKHELKDLFTEEEQMIIRSAIFHHFDKEHVHDCYDELLKDADLLQHWLYDVTDNHPISNRLIAIQKECGLPLSKLPELIKDDIASPFSRDKLGDIAESLASKHIKGTKFDPDYMKIIRYYPEESAFDELNHGWCAAFVYHCSVMAGLKLPLRYEPTANTRFACVQAWLHWGEHNKFNFWEKNGFIPARGDIIIYNNIISPENKPANTPWHDHIGVVLENTNEELLIAEGNVNNRNVSGIVQRKRNLDLGCFLRIPDDYEYDGWKYDYKTHVMRQQEF